MKSNGLSIILIILVLSITGAAATQVSKEFVSGDYGKFACAFGIGDCIYLITYDDGSTMYKLDRSILSTSSIVDSKSQLTATANIGQSASISYIVKGSGADGFNAHNQKYEWYDSKQNFIDVQSINLPYDKEYLWIHRVGPFTASGTFEYTIIEYIEINIVNQYCLHLPCNPEYKQVWAKADEYYPRVIVSGGQTTTPVPTVPTYTVQPTYPTYTIAPTPVPTNQNQGYWNVDVSTSNNLIQISVCAGSNGGYYRLKSTTNTVLRSVYLDYNMCKSSNEYKDNLYSIEHGDWTAYVTDNSGTIKASKSFNVNPGTTPVPTPTYPGYTVQPTYPGYTTQPTPGYTPPVGYTIQPTTPPGTGSTPSFFESNMLYIAIALILVIIVIGLWPTENRKHNKRR